MDKGPHARGSRPIHVARIVGIVAIAIVIAGSLGASARAQGKGGEVVARFYGVPATFSGGDTSPSEFTVVYDIEIRAMPDGSVVGFFDQRDSDDVLRGEVNDSGIPPSLRNPGKEKMTRGRMKNGRTLVYGHYEYVSPGGQTGTWSRVRFDLPAGALPFPAPEQPATTEETEEEEEAAGAAPPAVDAADTTDTTDTTAGGMSPFMVAFVVLLAILLLLLLLFLMFRLTSDDEPGWWERFKKWVKGKLRIGGRGGRTGSSVDMATVEESVETVREAVKDVPDKVAQVEKLWEYRLAMGEPVKQPEEQAWRDRRKRQQAWEKWRGDGQPEDLEKATPEQREEFEEAHPDLPPAPPEPSYGTSHLPRR